MSKDTMPKILVFGATEIGLHISNPPPKSKFCELEFCLSEGSEQFQNYDGVIIFQSAFEKPQYVQVAYGDNYWKVPFAREELNRRRNELDQLLHKGGFVCFLMHTHFIDSNSYPYRQDFTHTDLCKIHLNHNVTRMPTSGDNLISKIYRSEFQQFLKGFGIARTCFGSVGSNIKKICDGYRGELAGFILTNTRYFLPCRLPQASENQPFFESISSALIASAKKLAFELPEWLDDFRLHPETDLIKAEADAQSELEKIQMEKRQWESYKQILCLDGDALVERVSEVLESGFGLRTNKTQDEHIEDKTILDEQGKPLVLIEITGTNDNLKSVKVHQAALHRERQNMPEDFPSILIANTFIKGANSISEKDKPIADEQIRLAIKLDVLILRALDLLNLLNLTLKGVFEKKELLEILKTKRGWLKASVDSYELIVK